jgi:amidase
VRISRNQVVYRLEAGVPFIASVEDGASFLVETHDCRTGTITGASTADDLRVTSWINPVTGPIEVAGTLPGDVLAIDLDDVTTADHGLMIHRPGTTAIDDVGEPVFRIITMNDHSATVGPVSFPRRPMVGFIGLTPASGAPGTLLGGGYGGNMDTTLLTTGARLFLPVAVPGAGLHVGDLHAAMGDGEVYMTGIEVAGEVSLTVRRVPRADLGGRNLPLPLLENADSLVPIAAAETLDLAARAALAAGMTILTEWAGMDAVDAGFFLSAACNLRISQFLPGLGIHCRLEIPKQPLVDAGLLSAFLVAEPLPRPRAAVAR